jgi:hypothetical protein
MALSGQASRRVSFDAQKALTGALFLVLFLYLVFSAKAPAPERA